jgi:prepilin-type N-terminal cleavage/methylation domain-containing protein
MRSLIKKSTKRGFSLAELVIGTAVFLVISVAVYNSYQGVFAVVYASRAKIEAISLINEQLEIVRNLPYADVGIYGGLPSGKLSHTQTLVRSSYSFDVTTTVRNYDDPYDGTLGGTPNDLSPADGKVVEIEVDCAQCRNFSPMVVTTRVSPKNLETASTNGALFVKVLDANGNPLPDAAVHIENDSSSPKIAIDDVTNNSGMLQVVDAPPGANVYEITVTKSGYSTDKTYAATGGNPHPAKPHSTVALQQVTQVSFIIDKLSTFNISSVTDSCSPVAGVGFTLSGAKTIGTNPDVLKYSQDLSTDGGGNLAVNDIEWDSYTFAGADAAYDIVGTNPILPVNIAPDSSQNIQLIVAPKDPDTLLVTVRDSATSLPLSGVEVDLTKTGYSSAKYTGEGFVGQTDWSGGAGQATSTSAAATTQYLASDGNIENDDPAGDISLKKIFGSYVSSGDLVSSSFDTGVAANFQQVDWDPEDQPPSAGTPNVRIQIATNNDGATWDFKGPDGTASTYYTTSDKNIAAINSGNRYLRYKAFLDTATTTASPNISDISFTYTSNCTPPGQVSFSGLSSGTYNLHLEKAGYAAQDIPVTIGSSWQSVDATLIPS